MFFFLATIALVLLVLFPACAMAEWIGRRRHWPVLAQIPLSVGMTAVICGVIAAVVDGGIVPVFGWLFAGCLVPLGFYWWVAQSGPLLISVVRRARMWLVNG